MFDSLTLNMVSRRSLLQFGTGSYLGLNLGGLWRAQASAPTVVATKPIKACILVFLYGGPSHIDTFDMKPDAPAEVRGSFKPIATTAHGVRICEHLPRMAKLMHKVAVVRSMHHAAHLHDSGSIHMLTGRPLDGTDRELFAPLPQHFPSYGSAVAALRSNHTCEVPFASLPFVFHNVVPTPCQGGGFLGSAHDPLRIDVDTAKREYQVDVLQHKTRDRYGFGSATGNGDPGYAHQMRGQNYLLARRLVEAGVPFINIYDYKQQGQNWDAHAKCFDQHKDFLLPSFDQGLSALIEDLDLRGMLDSTLIVVTGEFGRTPKINTNAGRDHWPECSSVLLIGGGITGGAVHGSSDRMGAYPATNPTTPGDLAATIFARFGIDPATEIHDQTQRPYLLATGKPLQHLFGG